MFATTHFDNVTVHAMGDLLVGTHDSDALNVSSTSAFNANVLLRGGSIAQFGDALCTMTSRHMAAYTGQLSVEAGDVVRMINATQAGGPSSPDHPFCVSCMKRARTL